MTEWTETEKQQVRQLYQQMQQATPVHRQALAQQIADIRRAREGQSLFARDIEDQKALAKKLGLKEPGENQ